MTDFVESIQQRLRTWLWMNIEVNLEFPRVCKVLFQVLIVIGFACECSGRKLHFVLQNMLLQKIAERCPRRVLHDVHPDEVVVHQQTEDNWFVFLTINLTGILLAKEVGYCLLDAVSHAAVVYRRIEQTAVILWWIVALVAAESERSVIETVGCLSHLV